MKTLRSCRKIILSASCLAAMGVSHTVLADDHKTSEQKAARVYSECVAVRMKEINIQHLSKFDSEKHATAIPEGWTVISGTGGEGHPKLLLCR